MTAKGPDEVTQIKVSEENKIINEYFSVNRKTTKKEIKKNKKKPSALEKPLTTASLEGKKVRLKSFTNHC